MARMSQLLAFLVFLVFPRASLGQSCLQWSGGPPSARIEHAMAYDTSRGVLVLFGGNHDLVGFGTANGETWEWDGEYWHLRATTGPAPREGHALAFDEKRGVVVLFGGVANTQNFGDTWEWDGQIWTLRSSTGPTPRSRHAMSYDAARGVTVLHGGSRGSTATWEWDGTTWTLRSSSGPPRNAHSLVYDTVRKTHLLFGGNAQGVYGYELWEWDGEGDGSWTLLSDTGPGPRIEHAMAYDTVRGKAVLFGGDGQVFGLNETWEWDSASATWGMIQTQITPSGRSRCAMVYDSKSQSMLMFGGRNQQMRFGDLWTLGDGGTNWTLLHHAPPSRKDTAMAYDSWRGKTVLFGGGTLAVVGDTWEWDGERWEWRTSDGPSPREAHAMAFDSIRGVTVLFGGSTHTSIGDGFGDTWEWDGAEWSLRSTTGPEARWHHAMAYDSARGVVVLFGGKSDNSAALGDTWEWDGTVWVEREVTGPAPQHSHAMAFDAARSQTMLKGESLGTWLWNGTNWVEKFQFTPSPFGGEIAYDASRKKIVLRGPEPAGTVWSWNGLVWTLNEADPAIVPPESYGNVMAYDAARKQLVMFGGDYSSATWLLSIDCPADIDGNGAIDVDDLLTIINNWGPCDEVPCPGDITGNGVIDVDDLLVLINSWNAI